MKFRKLGFLAVLGIGSLLGVGTAGATTLTVLDLRGPLGGAEICVDSVCTPVDGVKNVLVTVTAASTLGGAPVVSQTNGGAPGCTAVVNKTVTVDPGTSSALVHVEFTPSDKNGNASGPTVAQDLVVPPIGFPKTITVCASI